MRAACALAALLLAGSVACSAVDVDLTDRPCAGGECIDGYVCSPFTDTCVQALEVGCRAAGAVCPATTRTGDGCSVADSFLPCVEGAGCERGCRLCRDDLTWSACEGCTLGDVRTCASCD